MADKIGEGKRVLLVGRSGFSGPFLAASDLVSEIGIGGRNRERLEREAAALGQKARAVQIDILDYERLATMAKDYDILLNLAGPENDVLIPGLRAAIEAGTHYCDWGGHGPTVQKQLELNSAALKRDIIAIPGMGICPGFYNLISLHACRQFDTVEEIQLCHFINRYFSQKVDVHRKSGRVDTSLRIILDMMSRQALVYARGALRHVSVRDNGVDILHPKGGTVKAYPLSFAQVVTFPKFLPDPRRVSCVLGVPNAHLADLMFSMANRISTGDMTAFAGTKSLLETVGEDVDYWLGASTDSLSTVRWDTWVAVTGLKEGRKARYRCRAVRFGHPTVVAALRILRGEVAARGVRPPEACFEPVSFFDEMIASMEEPPPDDALLEDSLEWLE